MSELDFLLDGVDAAERFARLRELRALVALYAGWDSQAKAAFDAALTDESAVAAALEAIARLPAMTRRRLLSSYGALTIKGW
jgi:hypothetical protein